MIRALIVDDEELARQGLMLLLQRIGNVEVIGQASDGIEAIEMVQKTSPDLLFLDINMPGLNGFQMLEQLQNRPAIIFTTAYNEYALNAFRENAIDYLLKPIQLNDLHQAIEKSRQYIKGKKIDYDVLSSLVNRLQQPGFKNRFLFEKGSRYIPVSASDIAIFFSKDKIVTAHLFNGQSYMLNETLEKLESQLDPEQFFRVNRQAIVNASGIKEIDNWFKGKLKLSLKISFNEELIISTERAQIFKSWLKS